MATVDALEPRTEHEESDTDQTSETVAPTNSAEAAEAATHKTDAPPNEATVRVEALQNGFRSDATANAEALYHGPTNLYTATHAPTFNTAGGSENVD